MPQGTLDYAMGLLFGDPPSAELFTQLQRYVYEQAHALPNEGEYRADIVVNSHVCLLWKDGRYAGVGFRGWQILRINLTHFRERLTRGALAHSTAVTILTDGERLAILERDGFRCRLCGLAASDGTHVRLEVDHRTPRCHGGLKDPSNLWTLCYACNQGKGDRVL